MIHTLQEMIRHLHEERDRQAMEIEELREESQSAKDEKDELLKTQKDREQEQEKIKYVEIHKNLEISKKVQSLEIELEEMKRIADLKIVECDGLFEKFHRSEQLLKQSKESHMNLEMQLQQMNDELDVARDKSTKLVKAEATIVKYQRKVEEMISLRKENREQLDKLDEYSNKIHELESSGQSMTNLQKIVEQYKNKSVEVEREKFEAVSALQVKENEANRLRTELDEVLDAKQHLDAELASARDELEHHLISDSMEIETDEQKNESKASLREKINALERELLSAKTALNTGKEGGPIKKNSTTDNENEQLALLQAEHSLLRLDKSAKEDMLMTTKQQLAETQAELQRKVQALNALQAQAATHAENKDAAQKLAQASITMKLLEAVLKEKETSITDLEQKKAQLEAFSKTTLASFKNKFMSTCLDMSNLQGFELTLGVYTMRTMFYVDDLMLMISFSSIAFPHYEHTIQSY